MLNIASIAKRHLAVHVTNAAAGAIVQLVALSLAAAFFGPIAFGKMALFMALANVLAIFSTLKLGGYLLSLKNGRERLIFANFLINSALVACAGIFIASFTIVSFSVIFAPEWNLGPIWISLSAYVLLQGVTSVCFNFHIAEERTGIGSAALLIRPTAMLVFLTALHLFGNSADVLIGALVLSEIAVVLYLLANIPAEARSRIFTLRAARWAAFWRGRWRFLSSGGLGAYLSNTALDIPILIASLVMTPVQIGHYAFLLKFAMAPVRIVAQPVSAISNREMAKRYHSGKPVGEALLAVYGSAGIIGIFGYGLLTIILLKFSSFLPEEWLAATEFAPVVFGTAVFLFSTATIGYAPLLRRATGFLVIWSGGRIAGICIGGAAVWVLSGPAELFLLLILFSEGIASLIFLMVNASSFTGRGRNRHSGTTHD